MLYSREHNEMLELAEKHDMASGLYDTDYDMLLKYSDMIAPRGVYVEIGVSNGFSLLSVAKHRKDIQCYGIENENKVAVDIISKEQVSNATFIFGHSSTVAKSWEAPIDLLFIDGDHKLPQIAFDVIGWFPHVKPGGYILFHDYEVDVKETVEQLIGHNKYHVYLPAIEDIISTSLAIIKKL